MGLAARGTEAVLGRKPLSCALRRPRSSDSRTDFATDALSSNASFVRSSAGHAAGLDEALPRTPHRAW